MERDRRARGALAHERPLLVIDGDSFAHRAYHALPKSIRGAGGGPAGRSSASRTSCCGSGRRSSRARSSSAGTRSSVPTYRHEALPATSRAASSTTRCSSSSTLLPELVEAFGFAVAQGGRATRPTTSSRPRRRGSARRHGLVATSDRDAFQLASEPTTILAARAGVSELARIGPAEVRERYGVEPEQVPDFIALRGDPSDKIPGARGCRPEDGRGPAARVRPLEAALAAGRFAPRRTTCGLYRRIATMDAAAPLAAARATRSPTGRGGGRRAPSELGLGALAGRLRGARVIELVTHRGARAPPSDRARIRESPERLRVLHERFRT